MDNINAYPQHDKAPDPSSPVEPQFNVWNAVEQLHQVKATLSQSAPGSKIHKTAEDSLKDLDKYSETQLSETVLAYYLKYGSQSGKFGSFLSNSDEIFADELEHRAQQRLDTSNGSPDDPNSASQHAADCVASLWSVLNDREKAMTALGLLMKYDNSSPNCLPRPKVTMADDGQISSIEFTASALDCQPGPRKIKLQDEGSEISEYRDWGAGLNVYFWETSVENKH